jgi:plasmid stabilization system protein ParE
MNFDVVWSPAAERELTELWLDAADRALVTEASKRIDETLERNAPNEGESRPDGRRVLFATPLAVVFRVWPDYRRVLVSHVWRFRTR